jgi:methionine-R-sulfoxide reductase
MREASRMIGKVIKSDEEWKRLLSREQYQILRQKSTEVPGTCAFSLKQEGVFHCVACNNPLFISKTEFESGTGWPSFFEPYSPESIILKEDRSMGMVRTEVLCARCEGHLGHVFDDGPPHTYKRFCINGTVLKFVRGEKKK